MRIEEVVGENIRGRREATGMTQEDLGRRVATYLDREWPRQSVSTAEKGGRSFTASELVAFALALNVSIRDLFRVPSGEHVLQLSSGRSVDAGLVEAAGGAEDPTEDLRALRVTLRELENRHHEQLSTTQMDLRELRHARLRLENLAEEWGQPAEDEAQPS